jgi:hypothetical protein
MFVTSAKGLNGGCGRGEDGADSEWNPIFLRISSFGDVAISLSNGVRVTLGESFGTARRMHPSGTLASKFFDNFHLFALPGAAAAVEEGWEVRAMVILVSARACVAGTGVSEPRRLKIERLRRLIELTEGCKAVGELFSNAMIALVYVVAILAVQ